MFQLCKDVGVDTYEQLSQRPPPGPARRHQRALPGLGRAEAVPRRPRRLRAAVRRAELHGRSSAVGAADGLPWARRQLDARTLSAWMQDMFGTSPSKLARDGLTHRSGDAGAVCTDPAELAVRARLVLARGGAGTKRGFEGITDSSLTETHLIDGDPPACRRPRRRGARRRRPPRPAGASDQPERRRGRGAHRRSRSWPPSGSSWPHRRWCSPPASPSTPPCRRATITCSCEWSRAPQSG